MTDRLGDALSVFGLLSTSALVVWAWCSARRAALERRKLRVEIFRVSRVLCGRSRGS